MIQLEGGRHAVELPLAHAAPASRRRFRPLTGLSGALLFGCMFLPAVKGCEQPVMPLEVPPFLPPYLFGLVFALIAMSHSPRALVFGAIALRGLAGLVALIGAVLIEIEPSVGIIELIIGLGLLVTVGVARSPEPRIAMTGIAISTVSVVWFGCWTVTPDALVGVFLSLASAMGLFTGCVLWLNELMRRPRREVPRARAMARR